MSRNYTNSLLFESCLDNLSETSEVKKLAKRIFQPFVEVVEEDCGTKLGTKISVGHDQRGEVDSTTSTPLTIDDITDYMSAGQYLLRARKISSCISDGGACRVCALGTYQDVASYPIPTVGSLLQLTLDFPVSVQVVPGLVSASSVTLNFSVETFDKLVVFTENAVLAHSSYSVSGNTLTFNTPVSGILVIKFVVNSLSPIIKEGYSSYFGSLLGAKPISLMGLVGREELYHLDQYDSEIDSVVADLVLAKAPEEITTYLNSSIPKLERAAAALICAAIFGVHEDVPQPPSWEYLPPDIQTVGSNLVVTRTVPPNSNVQLLLNGVVVLTTTADSSGSWTYTGSPLPGEYSIYYVSTPPGSMTGNSSASVLYTFLPGGVNLAAPAAFGSAGQIAEGSTVSGIVSTGGTTLGFTSVSNAVATPVGYTVQLYLNNSQVATTTTNSSGNWSISVASIYSDGAYSVKYRVSPSSGNPVSAFSPALSFNIATSIVLLVPKVFNGATQLTSGTSVTGFTSVSNTSTDPVGYTVHLFLNGIETNTATVDSSGNWSISLPEAHADGAYTISYKVSPSSGSPLSAMSPVFSITVATVPATPQPPFATVALLAHYNTGLSDSSILNHAFTTVGSPTISTATPKYGPGYLQMNGSNDIIRYTAQGTEFDLAGDFTIEAWVYMFTPPGGHADGIIASRFLSPNGGWTFRCTPAKLYFDARDAIAYTERVTYTAPISVNTWHHVSVTRQGTTMRLFLGGTLVATSTFTGTIATNTGQYLEVGGSTVFGTNYGFPGLIDDLRISNTCVYTATFPPPSSQMPDA